MHGLTLAVMFQAMLTAPTGDYQTAYHQAQAAGKPLLILVGSETSPDYLKMKQETLPKLTESGAFDNLVLTQVDSSVKPDLARQMLRGEEPSQLVLYTPVTRQTWRRRHISGAPTEQEVQAFLIREISKGLEVLSKSRDGATSAPASADVSYSLTSGSS